MENVALKKVIDAVSIEEVAYAIRDEVYFKVFSSVKCWVMVVKPLLLIAGAEFSFIFICLI